MQRLLSYIQFVVHVSPFFSFETKSILFSSKIIIGNQGLEICHKIGKMQLFIWRNHGSIPSVHKENRRDVFYPCTRGLLSDTGNFSFYCDTVPVTYIMLPSSSPTVWYFIYCMLCIFCVRNTLFATSAFSTLTGFP